MFDLQLIYSYLKKEFTGRDIFLFFVLIAFFFGTRLVNLDNFPIFADEGIYIRWAKVAWKDASWRFISLTDGRQPLQTWATIPFLKLFPDNALLAGRLFSVSTGFIALLGTFTLLFYLFKKQIAYIGALLYIFMPYFVFYDRMALVDSAVNAGFIWILFFSILLARTIRLDVAIMLGVVGGFTLLAKSSARMFLMLSVLAPVLFFPESLKKKSFLQFTKRAINFVILLGIAIVIALIMYNIQRLSPYMHFIEQKNTTFVMTMDEFLSNPFASFSGNIKLIPLYVTWEAGWVIVLFSVWGFIQLWRHDRRLFFYLLSFVVFPFIAIAFFAKVIFPRYLIFFGSVLLITASYSFLYFKQQTRYILLGFLVMTMLLLDYPLLFNASRASFPPVDRGQYVEGVTAVWGADELMSFFRQQSREKPVLVLAEGDFGLVGDVLQVYVNEGDQIEIKGLWPLEREDVIEYIPEMNERNVYIVFSHREDVPTDWPIQLVKKYEKPNSPKALYVYEYASDAPAVWEKEKQQEE